MVALHERRESPYLSAQFNLLQPSQRSDTPIRPLDGSVSGWRRRRWTKRLKSELLMSKAGARPCDEAKQVRVAGVGAQEGAGPRIEVVFTADEHVSLERAADLGSERALLPDGAVRCAGGEFPPRLAVLGEVD